MIILSAIYGMDRARLESMIRDVNTQQVRPEERLSDKPYVYDSKTHEILRMDYMERRKEQSKNRDRVSIKNKPVYGSHSLVDTHKRLGM